MSNASRMRVDAGRSVRLVANVALVTLGLSLILGWTPARAQNPIVLENLKPGTPASIWDISGAGDLSIQGFATEISVNKGETVHFKIQTAALQFGIDIFRLGYYGGRGARLVESSGPFTGPQKAGVDPL